MTTRLPSKPGDGSSFAHNQGSPNQFCRIQGAGPGHVSKRIDRHTARSASARWRQMHQPPAAATSQPRMQASTVTHSRKRELQERSSPKPAMANKPCRLNTGPAAALQCSALVQRRAHADVGVRSCGRCNKLSAAVTCMAAAQEQQGHAVGRAVQHVVLIDPQG